MRTRTFVALCAIAASAPLGSAAAQVAGQARLGVTVEEMRLVVLGWSVERDLLEKRVYNERNERIGEVEDVIVSPDRRLSWAIIDVEDDRFILPGATKEQVRDLPPFEYVRR